MFFFYYFFTIVFYNYSKLHSFASILALICERQSHTFDDISEQISLTLFFSINVLIDIDLFKMISIEKHVSLHLLLRRSGCNKMTEEERERKRRAWLIKHHREDFFLYIWKKQQARFDIHIFSFKGSLSIFEFNIRKSLVEKWEKYNAFCPWLLLEGERERNLSSTNFWWLILYYHPPL